MLLLDSPKQKSPNVILALELVEYGWLCADLVYQANLVPHRAVTSLPLVPHS